MKKSKLFLSILFTVLAIFIFGCQNHLLPSPKVETPTDDAEQKNPEVTIWAAPENLVATHGLKGKIELSWKGVKSAARYYIYEAPTPYDRFIQIAETTSNTQNYVLEENSGASKYYKITAVKKDGEESPFSTVAHGTTLANPVITYIGQDEENSDSASSVHWYMNNCNASTYQQNVRYTINCFDPAGNNVAEKIHDGNSDYPSIKFEDLTPNTNYTYQVTAYIVSHQNDTEISDKVDSATARRLRPNPPENLSATLGTSTSEITLTFDLPAMVDVALGNGIYEPKPLYFKIYRRIASEEAKEEDWQIIEDNFSYGEKDEGGNFVPGFSSQYTPSSPDIPYEVGQTITYTDSKELKRGIMYEYKVQSYADETIREISSNLSYTTTQGFLMAVPRFEITNIVYTDNELTGEERQFVKIDAKQILTWDNFGTEENYNFIVLQEKSLLEGDGGDGTIVEEKQFTYSTLSELNECELSFDLSSNPQNIRGYYKYTLFIVQKDETDINNAVVTTKAIGQLLVTNDVDTPKVKFFSVSNGYKDKIVVEWNYNSTYRYNLVYIEDGSAEEIPLTQEEMSALLADKVDGDTITFEHATDSGVKRSYKIYPTSSQTETNLPVIEGSTLATPVVTNENLYHEKIAINWNEIDADDFTINAKYIEETISNSNKIEDVKINVEESKLNSINPFAYTYENPIGFDNISVSGNEIEITVKANKQVTKNILKLVDEEAEAIDEMYKVSKENIQKDDLNVIETTEDSITTCTVGPAFINAKSVTSKYNDKLELTWNKVTGAKAYAIIRTQYIFNSDHTEEFSNTQKYLVEETDGAVKVSALGVTDEMGLIPANVNISLDGNKFTLIDNDINLSEQSANSWQRSQSQISWGCPYEYVVIPLVYTDEEIDLDTITSRPTSFNLITSSVTYNNLPYTRGSTIGYGWNVTASKGWQTTKLATEDSATNDSIYITWKNPYLSSTLSPAYDVYRRQEGSSSWESIATKVSSMSYEDKTAQAGIVYEYQVGLTVFTGVTNPSNDIQYVEFSDQNKDTKHTEEKLASGFILPQPKMRSASREARAGNTELITWYSASVGDENNRMIDGYVIEVYNNNIDANWHVIKTFNVGSDLDKELYEFAKEVDNASGLLKVLRDYKHYFRVRAFTTQDDKYCYSPAPKSIDEDKNETESIWKDGLETDYVKWGARQITAQEFCKIATLTMAIGIHAAVNDQASGLGTAWCGGQDGSTNVSEPGSGSASIDTYGGAFSDVRSDINFSDYKPILTTKSGKQLTFVKIGTSTLYGNTDNWYATHCPIFWKTSSDGNMKITGPSDVNLYTGEIFFIADMYVDSTDKIKVIYNDQTVKLPTSGNCAIPFKNTGWLDDTEEWK